MSPAVRIGDVRPSQLLHTYGVGSVIDLPHLSGLILGLDDWDTTHATEISEDRLLAAVRRELGSQVSALRLPPYLPEQGSVFDLSWAGVGVPVAVFPRWLRCPRCGYLGPLSAGLFTLREEPFRPDRVRYEHGCTGGKRSPTAIPVRFLLACRNAHLDEFPWDFYVHRGASCGQPLLKLEERGVSGEASDIWVRCRSCDASRSMVEAFGETAGRALPRCRARHPHLSIFEESCDQPVRTILLGASNLWFADSISVFSIPRFEEPLAQKVAELWPQLQGITSTEVLAYARSINPHLRPLARFEADELLAAIEAHRSGDSLAEEEDVDVLGPEWEAFANPQDAQVSDDFRLRTVAVPATVAGRIADVVLAERLRAVKALIGFARIDAPRDQLGVEPVVPRAPLSRTDPVWVPCAETRGEGVFIRFPEEAVRAWEERIDDHPRARQLLEGHQAWQTRRNLPHIGFPGGRYLLLHTFSHLLMRELALEAGYGAASISERIYAAREAEPMAGVLLYTAATDSEGTLGGLVSLGEPDTLGGMIEQALSQAELCTSDPMCAEHDPTSDASTHGAACHACLFAPETACERGNRYLDRTLLVDTLAGGGLRYFLG